MMSASSSSSASAPSRLRVRILTSSSNNNHSHNNNNTAHVLEFAVVDIVERELEMQTVAATYDITGHRWSGSRLYKEYQTVRHTATNPTDDTVVVTLDPVKYCRDNNLCQDLVWTKDLTKLIHDFYTSSVLQVEDDMGRSFLLALEYFGILYQPDQLVFGSLEAYKLVKEWSDYLAQRSLLADWVAEQILRGKGGKQKDFYFGTCVNTEWQGRELPVLTTIGDTAIGQDEHMIWAFFNAPITGREMQNDFCLYLQNLLTQVEAVFMRQPAILHIRIVPSPPSVCPSNSKRTFKSEISYPMDERDSYAFEEKKVESPEESPRRLSEPLDTRFDQTSEPVHADTAPTRYELVEKPVANASASKQVKKKERKQSFRPKHPWKLNRTPPSKKTSEKPKPAASPETRVPVAVVRARSADVSVLTGPFFLDGDGIVHDVYANDRAETAEALRQEWIQGSVMNRGMSNRIRVLLEDASEAEDVSLNRYEPGCRGIPSPRASENALSWDWFDSICSYSDSRAMNDDRSSSKAAVNSILLTVLERILGASGLNTACGGGDYQHRREPETKYESRNKTWSNSEKPSYASPTRQNRDLFRENAHARHSSPYRVKEIERCAEMAYESSPARCMVDSLDSESNYDDDEIDEVVMTPARPSKPPKVYKQEKRKQRQHDVQFTGFIRHKSMATSKPSVTQSTSTTAASSRSSPRHDNRTKASSGSNPAEPRNKKLSRIKGLFKWRKRFYV